MRWMNTKEGYGVWAVCLHWLMGLLLLGLWSQGQWMRSLPYGAFRAWVYGWHKQLGMLALLLIILRTAIRWKGASVAPVTMSPWQQRLSQAVHTFLYGLMWLMPLAGYLMSLASGRAPVLMGFLPTQWLGTAWFPSALWALLKEVAGIAHAWGAKVLLGAVILHVLGFISHLWSSGGGYVRRMGLAQAKLKV